MTKQPPAHLTDWQHRGLDTGLRHSRLAPEQPVLHPDRQLRRPRPRVPRPAGRADLGDPVRRPPRLASSRWSPRPATGSTASSWAPPPAARPPPPRPAQSASSAATRWPCCPFIGYHAGDYFQHWLDIGKDADARPRLPKVFFVNWFRKSADGHFLWPGYGENSRVLEWIIGRITGTADAVETPIGLVPTPASLDTDGPRPRPDRRSPPPSPSTPTSGGPRSPSSRNGSPRSATGRPHALRDQLERPEVRLDH